MSKISLSLFLLCSSWLAVDSVSQRISAEDSFHITEKLGCCLLDFPRIPRSSCFSHLVHYFPNYPFPPSSMVKPLQRLFISSAGGLWIAGSVSVCEPVQADGGAVRMVLNGIVDLITLCPSRPDRSFSLLTGSWIPLLGEQPISSYVIWDKLLEFVALCPCRNPKCISCGFVCVYVWERENASVWICPYVHCLCVHKLMYVSVCVCLCMHVHRCLFIYAFIVYGCMCNCVYVTHCLTFTPVTAWGLNYLCVCVCMWVWVGVWVVSEGAVIILLLSAPTPVLQLTCSVLGPTRPTATRPTATLTAAESLSSLFFNFSPFPSL